MLYCTKCHAINEEGAGKCIKCKNHKSLREVNADDFVFLHNADQYTASVLEADFKENGITYEIKPFDTGYVSYMYDSEVMPTDKTIFVKYSDIDKARELSSKLKEKMEQEQEVAEDNMSPRKRLVVQIISVVLFLALITVVVIFADYAANGLKDFFTGLFSSKSS